MKLMPRKRSTGMTEASVLSQWDHYVAVCKEENRRFVDRCGGILVLGRNSNPNNKRGGRPRKVLETAHD